MSIKNTRARLKDIKQGRTFFTAHPVYGIEEWRAESKPFISKYSKSLFVKVSRVFFNGERYTSESSLLDSGIVGNCYNGRRTFRKLKQAQEWVRIWAKEPSFIKEHNEHEEFCKMWDDLDSMYDDDTNGFL